MALTKRKVRRHRQDGGKRMTRLHHISNRARCSPDDVAKSIEGKHWKGWDTDYILARYLSCWGTALKRETLMRIYSEEQVRDANTEPARISPAFQAKLDALGAALSRS